MTTLRFCDQCGDLDCCDPNCPDHKYQVAECETYGPYAHTPLIAKADEALAPLVSRGGLLDEAQVEAFKAKMPSLSWFERLMDRVGLLEWWWRIRGRA